jgi:hypothetical protein
LRRLYGRFFPAYFGPPTIEATRTTVDGHWLNLWAPSDFIGTWVLARPPAPGRVGLDERIIDPTSLLAAADGSWPQPCGHSGYVDRPEFEAAVDELAAR